MLHRIQENLYTVGDTVWFTEQSCFALIEMVRTPISVGPYLYDIECDDGEKIKYINEDRLYPGTPVLPVEEEDHARDKRVPTRKAKLLQFPRSGDRPTRPAA